MDALRGGHRPVIIAHRGSSASAPENTMAAFRRAAEEGADMIELDVRMSRDGHLVVHHDRKLGRTSNGRGRVVDLRLDELRRFDAGSWFGRSFAGERILLLEEVLEWLPSPMGLNIEVKTDGDRRGPEGYAVAIRRVLRRTGLTRRVLLSSFDHTFLQMAHSGTPRPDLGALVGSPGPGRARPAAIARRTGASVLILHHRFLRARWAESARDAGMALVCYGVETRAHLRRLRARRLDGMITNNPALLGRLLEEIG